ncbi:MAG: DUF3857 domain-containing protein [Bacteroidales bacterium]|jgi:hypothetical protein
MIKAASILFVSLMAFISTFGQNDPEYGKFYNFEENEVKDFCWNSSNADTRDTVVPADWRNEPAVYLYFENFYETIRLASKAHAISYIAHYRIKILDKSALDNLSEIYYSQNPVGDYSLNYMNVIRQKNYLGIKVIKPDGTEIVLNNDDFIEENDGDKKVAVPNLEIGDIIDYYQYTYDYGKVGTYVVREQFVIGGNYPIKHFNYQLLTNKHWDVMFTTGKNGPEIKEEIIDKKYYKFSVSGSDFPSSARLLWTMPYYDFPYIKLMVKEEVKNMKTKEDAKSYRTTEISNDKIKETFSAYYVQEAKAGNEWNSFLRYLKKNGKSNITREKKLEEYFYFLRHRFKNMHYIYDQYNNSGLYLDDDGTRQLSSLAFTGHMIYGLNKLKIRYDLVAVPVRRYGPFDDLLSVSETSYMIRAKLKDPVFIYKPSFLTSYNDLPYFVEGVEGFALSSPDGKIKNLNVKTTTTPVSAPEDNSTSQVIDVKFNTEDPMKLDINTDITYSGETMREPKEFYIDDFAMIWAENDRYETKKWGSDEQANKKVQVQMEEFTASKEKKRKEHFEALAKGEYETDDIELGNYSNLNTGNEPGEYDFKINFECTAGDLVKKVGNNYILKAGQLMGSQVTIDEENLERTVDIYMNYPRVFNYAITIHIPEGYEVSGFENFNISVDNATGSLIAIAENNKGVVTIKVSKTYKHNFENAENWGLMKEFLIPASAFPSKELLLRKI